MKLNSNFSEKISLGSANFGSNYGIANEGGALGDAGVRALLNSAKNIGITKIDTASMYHGSEDLIGKNYDKDLIITTKISVPDGDDFLKSLEMQIKQSFTRLGVRSVENLLLHTPTVMHDAKRAKDMIGFIDQLKSDGVIKNFGLSVYDDSSLFKCHELDYIDVIQVPFNVFDQRLLSSGVIDQLQELGKVLQIRSVFLQGLLLMDQGKIPPYFDEWRIELSRWDEICKEIGSNKEHVALAFCLCQKWADTVILGVDNVKQFSSNVAGMTDMIGIDLSNVGLSIDSESLLNPSLWSKN